MNFYISFMKPLIKYKDNSSTWASVSIFAHIVSMGVYCLHSLSLSFSHTHNVFPHTVHEGHVALSWVTMLKPTLNIQLAFCSCCISSPLGQLTYYAAAEHGSLTAMWASPCLSAHNSIKLNFFGEKLENVESTLWMYHPSPAFQCEGEGEGVDDVILLGDLVSSV